MKEHSLCNMSSTLISELMWELEKHQGKNMYHLKSQPPFYDKLEGRLVGFFIPFGKCKQIRD